MSYLPVLDGVELTWDEVAIIRAHRNGFVPEPESDPQPDNPYGFIPVDGGMMYIRQSEISGLKWELRYDYDVNEEPIGHVLVVGIDNGIGAKHFYGDDAAQVMRILGLPEKPPR